MPCLTRVISRFSARLISGVVRKICTSNLEYIRGVKMHRYANAPQIILQWTRALQGLTKSGVSFTDGSFDEDTFLQAYQGDGFFDMFYFVAKLAVLCIWRVSDRVARRASGRASRARVCWHDLGSTDCFLWRSYTRRALR